MKTSQIYIAVSIAVLAAIVDVDTLWRHWTDGTLFLWKGRACKGYTKVGSQWFLVYHTGLLEYGA